MTKPRNRNIIPPAKRSIEVVDILREHIKDYQEKYPLHPHQYKIVSDLLNCRTAYLGGHIEKCDHCGSERITYNSCRNRHCPKCQNIPRERWLKARKAELLPVSYFHTVFTLPHDLNPIILRNRKPCSLFSLSLWLKPYCASAMILKTAWVVTWDLLPFCTLGTSSSILIFISIA